ncbi:MAG: anthranilate synthase component I [Gemmatimonadetes bacterium]|nr:anthranilate synthase component I [Gemmatimonadota bacterium]NIQ60399.1 anthranilate synthase component I [Gemmatimonadota bacterium]NIU80612.1 anthranilate synthase component I [Gammaproteobacteria bacterium]NIX48913.1 anthranilate synthase component I [Gemmatimonadota bacterium]NIY13362.1 anthranilate synthase component I [Gemmatimonadota bacterium]
MIRPDFDSFVSLATQGDVVAVTRSFPFDTDTAVTAYAKLATPPFGFLLESVTGGERWARWTFLGTEPREAWRAEPGGRVRRWTPDEGWGEAVVVADPIEDLARRLRDRAPVVPPGVPRFFGGAVGYLGYDMVRYIERLPHPPPDPLQLPEAVLAFTDVVLAVDNVYGRAHAIATVDVRDADHPDALRPRYDAAVGRIDDLVRRLRTRPGPPPLEDPRDGAEPPEFHSSFGREGFEGAVRRVKEYITAGDAFQVVLSQRLDVPLAATPFETYRALRSLNPSPYMYFLELDDVAIVGSSPEVLVRVEDDAVTVRPIAGTRPRGASETEDRELEQELLADEKERAEHLMLVDLGRNDVGRVARYGTVRVPELMAIERYSHVLHMVSQVEGDLRDGLDAFDAFRATFPAGTVSGAPKVRAMEIIDELEPVRRGPYAGAVGYFAYGGRAMDTAIAIRTLVARRGTAHVQAGAGIVADSDPAREYQETLAKARALLTVLGRSGSAGD